MKQFPHIISKLFYEPVAITPAKHSVLCRVVEAHMAGNFRADSVVVEDGEPEMPEATQVGNTVIIPVHGVIEKHMVQMASAAPGCDLDVLGQMIDVAMSDKEVSRLVFDFRTPGGSVTGLPEMARKIAGIVSKETVAFTDSECCSAGVWLATQCQTFYATESACVGSIGVWCAYADYSRQLANEGVNIQSISAGKYKLLGAYWRTLSDEEKGMLQASVDKLHNQFKQAVNLRREVADEYMQGQTFDGQEGVEIGLLDGLVESMDELIDD